MNFSEKRKRILIVAPFISMPDEIGFNRFTYIARGLADRGHEVTVVTSRFSHYLKTKRSEQYVLDERGYEIYFLDETGYNRNVSLKRAVSHLFFLHNLRKFLLHRSFSYDLIYAALPMVGSAFLASRMKSTEDKAFVVDIQDLWPEAPAFALPGPTFLWRFVLAPIGVIARRTYAGADAVIGVSETYVETARRALSTGVPVRSFYIGADVQKFARRMYPEAEKTANLKHKGLELVYIGTLGNSYDLKTVFRALCSLASFRIPSPRLTLIGDGPQRKELVELADSLQITVKFRGTVSYDELAETLCSYDLAVNPYYKGALQSLTNKLADYLAAGLPILNAANNPEVETLIEKYELGYNYKPEDDKELCNLIIMLNDKREEIRQRSLNSRSFAEKYMDRERIYTELFNLVEDCF